MKLAAGSGELVPLFVDGFGVAVVTAIEAASGCPVCATAGVANAIPVTNRPNAVMPGPAARGNTRFVHALMNAFLPVQ
ncbi:MULTISPECIES: hypothetical protein [unclassified Micromonospora]|uniref:hypothetical protein n=1 Tax=unclassified Micromonospora TaxID=2617518 RepID=UPI0036311BE1